MREGCNLVGCVRKGVLAVSGYRCLIRKGVNREGCK